MSKDERAHSTEGMNPSWQRCRGRDRDLDRDLPGPVRIYAVWACRKCNSDKADRTPREAGMPLLYTSPYVPTYLDIHDPIY